MRKRLRASNAWLLWLLGELIAVPSPPPGPVVPGSRQVRLIDATRLRHPGGTGDDWRVHFAYNFTLSRMDAVLVTDQHTAERLAHFTLRPGDIAVVDNGYGYRASVAIAVRQDADVVLRFTPATFPVETAAGVPFDLSAWLRQTSATQQEWQGWCVHDALRYALRVLAARLPPEAAARARQQKYQQAQKRGRTPSAATLARADWVLVATTLAADWSLQDVLRLYRAGWQVERIFKRMKQLLRFNQLRSTHRTTVEATVRALLVAWALQDGIVAEIRALLPTAPPDAPLVVSTWSLVGLAWRCCSTRSSIGGRWPGCGPASPAYAAFCAAARVVVSIRKRWSAPGWRGGIPSGNSWRTMLHEQYGLGNAPEVRAYGMPPCPRTWSAASGIVTPPTQSITCAIGICTVPET